MALPPWANLIHQGLSQFKASAANFCNSAMLLEGSTETSFSSPIKADETNLKGIPFQLHFGLPVHIFHLLRNLAFCSRPGTRETSAHLYSKRIGKRQLEGRQRFEQLNKLCGRDTWEGGCSLDRDSCGP